MPRDVLIVEAVRTPFSPFGGPLKDIPSIELGACVIREIVKCARQAALIAGLPPTQVSLTIDRACCSSMASAILALRTIRSLEGDVMMAVGAVNMSRTPQIAPAGDSLGTKDGTDCLSGLPVTSGTSRVSAGVSERRENGARIWHRS